MDLRLQAKCESTKAKAPDEISQKQKADVKSNGEVYVLPQDQTKS